MKSTPEAMSPASGGFVLRRRAATAFRILREQGPGPVLRIAMRQPARLLRSVLSRLDAKRAAKRLEQILATLDPAKRPIVLFSTVDFAFPFAQRPQHLARAFAALGHACFYVTPRAGYDWGGAFQSPAPNLFVTDQDRLLEQRLAKPIVLVLSTDNSLDLPRLERLRAWTPHLVYEYIDHIDAAISGKVIPQGHIDAHRAILADPEVTVVASAQVLFDEVATIRRENLLLATNGVDLPHYAVTRQKAGLRADFAEVLEAGRPVVGYFGALASWFDYDLVNTLARQRPDLSIVLIGPDYDGTGAAWRKRVGSLPANLYVLPPMDYSILPRHAVWFDVATIPFLVNDITLATSPLKLYEYFAMGAPVVSTPLPECAKHEAVLIAATAEEFARRVDEAIALRASAGHRALLRKEAEANSWDGKARVILRDIA